MTGIKKLFNHAEKGKAGTAPKLKSNQFKLERRNAF